MMILLIGSLSAALAQDSAGLRVIGNVTDEKGEPLVAATVYAKNNKSVNAITDLDGNYSIVVPDKWTVLVFDFVGYVTKEETVGERKVINVELVEDIGQLDDAVVVAYGTQKKESVVASITSIEPSALKVSTSRSLTNNLAGNVAGVLAIQRSGEPGYDNSTFWIRGISTFQGVGGDPLVLVDGIERSLDTIDAEEIASFSVLKDAAASAVYGVRGANGVILINTKRGEAGKPKVTIKAEFAGTQPVKLPSYIGSADYMQLLDDVLVDTGSLPMYTDQIAKTRAGYDPDIYPDVNWWSCDVNNDTPLNLIRPLLSAVIDSMSRWLVGSSNTNTFAPIIIILEIRHLTFSPPESTLTFLTPSSPANNILPKKPLT